MILSTLVLLAGAVSPEAPPPAPPAMVSSIDEPVFYFERNSVVIDPRSGPVWEMIDYYVAKSPPTWMRVIGHADSAGSPDDNMTLSARRGEAIARRIAGMGVNPAIITIHACGEFRRAVATGDGVDEPLNRRVTVEWGEGEGPGLRPDKPCKVFPYPPAN